MIKETRRILVSQLVKNEGQVEWLGRNPRQWTKEDVDRTAHSIDEDPDFLDERPLLVRKRDDKHFLVFAGNLRLEGAKALKMRSVPSVVYYPVTEEDRQAVRRRALKDNGSFGKHDPDILANEWDDLPFETYGVKVIDRDPMAKGLSSQGREGGEGYDKFVDKFKPKLTTDDCYTPPEVYDIVRDFVNEKVSPLEGKKIIRPFYPGGDFEKEDYPEGCVVIDNPPFSIYAKIIRFYVERGIQFFLFGPNLTLFSARSDVCYIVANVPVVYENGAVVSTGFVTNMVPGIQIWVEPTIREKIVEAQKSDNEQFSYIIPDNVVTSARLGKLAANGRELKIASLEASYVSDLDGMKEIGKGLYGGGFLLSRAAAERAAAERAAAEIHLSEKELAIVRALDEAAEN